MPDSSTKSITHSLLTAQGLEALARSWTNRMVTLANKLSKIPHDGTTAGRWGFVFAVDNLRNNPRGVAALLEVVDEFDRRPTYAALLQLADQLVALKGEVRDVVQRQHLPVAQRTKKFGFRRGK